MGYDVLRREQINALSSNRRRNRRGNIHFNTNELKYFLINLISYVYHNLGIQRFRHHAVSG